MQRQRLAALDDAEWSEATWRRNSSETDLRESIRGLDFRRVREEIIQRSPGLFNVPPAWREAVPDPVSESHEVGTCYHIKLLPPKLPDRPFAEHLLQLFRNEVFAISPSVELDVFMERAIAMYDYEGPKDDTGIPMDASRSWLTLFFAALALTAQCIQDDIILQHYATSDEPDAPIGLDLADAAATFFGPITKKQTLDDIRGALLLGTYYKHINELGAANLWLGASVKMAQYMGDTVKEFILTTGCHRYSPGLNRSEEEARAKAWWDIYLFDRSVSLLLYLTHRILAGQQGCEMTIVDNDCDLPPPDAFFSSSSATSEHQQQPPGRISLHTKLYSWTIVHGRVFRLLRDSSYLSQEEIEKLDDRIQAQYDRMPIHPSYNADATPNPAWYLDNHVFVHNTKLKIYRHNISPSAPMSSRFAALRSLIEFAKETAAVIAEKFRDDTDPLTQQEANEYNQRVLRIVYPEHVQFLYSCAMYLVVAKLWTAALPYVIALRAIGNKLAINKSSCRYLWGVIIFTEGRESILRGTQKDTELETLWTEEDEETLTLIAADMHQDGRTWEAVWQKNEAPVSRSLDISPLPGEMELDPSDDIVSTSETSEVRSGPSGKASVVAESDVVLEESASRPSLPYRWSGESETWESMLSYVREKCDEQRQMEELKASEMALEITVSDTARKDSEDTERDAIQRRMSIANLL